MTYGEIFAVQPFGNSMVTMSLTGAQIDTLLEVQLNGCGVQNANRILQASAGFTYCWSAGAPASRKVDPATIAIKGVVVDPAAKYPITVDSFMAAGGDNLIVLREGTDRLGGAVITDAFEAYMRDFSPVAPGPRNSITVVP